MQLYCNSRACIALHQEAIEQVQLRQESAFSPQSVPAAIGGFCGAEQQQLDPALQSGNALGSVVLTAVTAAASETASPWLIMFMSRVMTAASIVGILFAGSMLLNQMYSLLTGLSNIERCV